jgi:hypothetical protein
LVTFAVESTVDPKRSFLLGFLQQSQGLEDLEKVISADAEDEVTVGLEIKLLKKFLALRVVLPHCLLLHDGLGNLVLGSEKLMQELLRRVKGFHVAVCSSMPIVGPRDHPHDDEEDEFLLVVAGPVGSTGKWGEGVQELPVVMTLVVTSQVLPDRVLEQLADHNELN